MLKQFLSGKISITLDLRITVNQFIVKNLTYKLKVIYVTERV